MKNGHFDARGTLASSAAPKFFFKFFGFHICDRAWFWLRVAPPTILIAPIVAEKNVSRGHFDLPSYLPSFSKRFRRRMRLTKD